MSVKKCVDVIILSWDRAAETKLAILSAVNQKNVISNVYVVDQGSKKECLEEIMDLVNKHENAYLHINNHNTGVPAGRNKASKLGSGDFIVSLDNDAEFVSNFELEKVVNSFESRKDVGVLAFNIKSFGTGENDESSWSYGLPSKHWANSNFYTTRFVGAGHAIRRDIFEKVNGYDDSLFFLHEEVDLSRRIINLGYKIEYIHSIEIGHKVSSEHRVSWSSGRWSYHVRNKTYLDLKFCSPIASLLFHTSLLIRDGFRKNMTAETLKSVVDGYQLYKKNKKEYMPSHCKFTRESLAYYRKYTPGAEGNILKRAYKRLMG